MQRAKTIIITGGGTGGHIMPALAVAEELTRRDCHVVFIGGQELERQLVEQAGFTFYGVSSGKLRRYFALENVTDLLKVAIGFFQARNILARLKPDAVFTKGGYVAVPVTYAAAFLEIPIIAHESDTVIGLANRLVAPKAEVICTGFPIRHYSKSMWYKLRFTGNPIRSIFHKPIPHLPKKNLRLNPNRKAILVMGGSQGAQAINRLVWAILPTLLRKYQIIHLTGVNHLAEAAANTKHLSPSLNKYYHSYGFVTDLLPCLMAAADIVVTRASANVLAELAFMKKSCIVLPLPSAASGHQWSNARVLRNRQAAIVLDEERISAADLLDSINSLAEDSEKRQTLARSIQVFSSPNAASVISEVILEEATKESES